MLNLLYLYIANELEFEWKYTKFSMLVQIYSDKKKTLFLLVFSYKTPLNQENITFLQTA